MIPAPGDPHVDLDVGLEMRVPQGWEVAATDELPLVLLAPVHTGFRANIGVGVGTLEPPTPEGFEALVERMKASRAGSLTRFHLSGERVAPQAGHPGWQMRATFEVAGTAYTQVTQLFVAEPARLYEVTATCLHELEQEYLPTFRTVLGSWRVVGESRD